LTLEEIHIYRLYWKYEATLIMILKEELIRCMHVIAMDGKKELMCQLYLE
jgi:hypothetical protein